MGNLLRVEDMTAPPDRKTNSWGCRHSFLGCNEAASPRMFVRRWQTRNYLLVSFQQPISQLGRSCLEIGVIYK